jgi:homoserine kinase
MSGSGPALFALCDGDAAACGRAMAAAFESAGVAARFASGKIAAAYSQK